MLTVQMLVKNNESTVERALASLAGIEAKIIVGDIGSSDSTLDICRSHGAEVIRLKWVGDYSIARNELVSDGMNLMIEPWEFLASGSDEVASAAGNFNVTVVRGTMVSKELRLWRGLRFKNPVYETVEDDSAGSLGGVAIVSHGGPDRRMEAMDICMDWVARRPTSPEPWYYAAFSFLSLGKTDEFITHAERYMAMTNKFGPAELQVSYRMAMVLASRKEYQKAMAVVMGCLFHRPSFAEFWCLAGDVFAANGDRMRAKSMYLNALAAGSRRMDSDPSPLDISKYKNHPERMLARLEEKEEAAGSKNTKY